MYSRKSKITLISREENRKRAIISRESGNWVISRKPKKCQSQESERQTPIWREIRKKTLVSSKSTKTLSSRKSKKNPNLKRLSKRKFISRKINQQISQE